jgi:hypothetical protein
MNLRANPLLKEILEMLDKDFVDGWKASATAEAREAFHAKSQALTIIRSRIDGTVKRELGDKQPNESGAAE